MDGDILDMFLEEDIIIPPQPTYIRISNAREHFENTFRKIATYFKFDYTYQKGYDDVVDWLSDNKGKGLALLGGCGVGKTMMLKYVLPYVISTQTDYKVAQFDATKFRSITDIDNLLKNKNIAIDDVGVEEVVSDYGNKVNPFSVIMDEVEKYNKMILFTSNLLPKELKERYKTRTYDRLKATVTIATILGSSNR